MRTKRALPAPPMALAVMLAACAPMRPGASALDVGRPSAIIEAAIPCVPPPSLSAGDSPQVGDARSTVLLGAGVQALSADRSLSLSHQLSTHTAVALSAASGTSRDLTDVSITLGLKYGF
jgi:hypothetical protein